jgi:hypothetical protein
MSSTFPPTRPANRSGRSTRTEQVDGLPQSPLAMLANIVQ